MGLPVLGVWGVVASVGGVGLVGYKLFTQWNHDAQVAAQVAAHRALNPLADRTPEEVMTWLNGQLEDVIGLDTLKEQLRKFAVDILQDKRRRDANLPIADNADPPHMIFRGNPGTGKTKMGRLMAELLHGLSMTPASILVEVQRGDLVAGYIGQTALRTRQKIEGAKDGVLFVDEAYRLSSSGPHRDDFGQEAIEELMSAMEKPPGEAPVMIFAGYTDQMRTFVEANAGLGRRIPHTFDFVDYTCAELARMFALKVQHEDYQIDANNDEVAAAIERGTTPELRSKYNGGICDQLFNRAKSQLNARIGLDGEISVKLSLDDIQAGCLELPPEPEG
jgi:SpoVK/Ycf46/Vps4 family AAA+-type ATPase